MAKAKVTFKPVRNSEEDWSIVAECPGVDAREIIGLKSKADVDDWMNGERRIAWLHSVTPNRRAGCEMAAPAYT